MVYLKPTIKSQENNDFPCFMPFLIVNASDKYLHEILVTNKYRERVKVLIIAQIPYHIS
jgi:hypothetical protein